MSFGLRTSFGASKMINVSTRREPSVRATRGIVQFWTAAGYFKARASWHPKIAGYELRKHVNFDGTQWKVFLKVHIVGDAETLARGKVLRTELRSSVNIWPTAASGELQSTSRAPNPCLQM